MRKKLSNLRMISLFLKYDIKLGNLKFYYIKIQ